jgi:signal transduction histidine kinase
MDHHDFKLFDVSSWRRHLAYGRIYHYLWAIIFVLFVVWLKVNFNEYFGVNTPFLLFAFTVFLSTYFGGLGPGLLSLLLSSILIKFLFLQPDETFLLEQNSWVPIIAYIIEGFIIVYLVTKQRRMLFQKIELDRQKDDFISASSHELNTPLTSMKIYIDVLQHKVKAGKHHQYEEPLAMLHDQTERLIRLVSSMLDITRLKANRVIFRHEKVNLMSCIRSVVKGIQNASPLHEIILEGEITKYVWGDEDRLGQVVSNLLTNAIKYSPRGGVVTIKLKEIDTDIEISVQDTGIGIEKSHQKKIFDRFYRAVDTNESTFSGLGIGLYLSSEIVKKHKGKIWVESEKGKGATFYVTLPVATENNSKL